MTRTLPRSSRRVPVALTLLLLLLLAACGGGEEASPGTSEGAADTSSEAADSGASEEAADAGGAPEVAEITVGTLPIVDVAPIQVAQDEGLFEAEGLTVATEVMQGGAAAIPALVSGDLDIAFGAWPSFFQANAEGLDLKAVAAGVGATEGFTLIQALPDSDLEGAPADLAGRTVAVNTLNNLGELAVRSAVQDAGGDPQAVELVEIPFPDMVAALERGDVDAIWGVEPTATTARNQLDAVTVVDSYVGAMEGFPVAGFQSTAQFTDANPNTVAAFQRAITAASEMIAEDEQVARDAIQSYTELPEEVIAEVTLPEFVSELSTEDLQRVADYMNEFGILDQQVDAATMVAGG